MWGEERAWHFTLREVAQRMGCHAARGKRFAENSQRSQLIAVADLNVCRPRSNEARRTPRGKHGRLKGSYFVQEASVLEARRVVSLRCDFERTQNPLFVFVAQILQPFFRQRIGVLAAGLGPRR